MLIEYLILSAAVLFLAVAASNVVWWPRVGKDLGINHCTVSVLIPARNEEYNLPDCLDSVLRQGGEVGEVLVYDDHSTDGTARVIGGYARADGRVRQVAALPLPRGWCGKNFACAQLAAAARGDWLLLLDADARLERGAVGRMLGEAERREITFLSCWPGLRLVGFWEKTLMPLLNFVVFSLYPGALAVLPLSGLRRDPKLGLAHGACLFIHRRSYEEFGGHGVVRDQIFEDTRLAQLWRAGGRGGLCLDGQGVVSLRMYSSFAEIWRGFQKNFYPAFKHELSFWLFVAVHGAVHLAPFLLLPFYRPLPIKLSVVTVIATRGILNYRFNHPWRSVILHPLGETILVLLGLSSWLRCRIGKGVEWKGRQYRKAAGAE
jgi:glycosyltransferase involved in cell wall biosynthesis